MRVTLVISSLAAGGAQRVMLDLAHHLQEQGHAVALLTFSDGTDDFFSVPRGVVRVALGLLGRSRNVISAGIANVRRLLVLRKAIRSTGPDVVVSFIDITNVAVILATRFTGIPAVASERTDPRSHRIGPIWDGLRRVIYPFCSRLVVQTNSVAGWASGVVRGDKTTVIANAVPRAALLASPGPVAARENLILAVGRLEPVKGFDLLIRAFASSSLAQRGWRLAIVGEGSQRQALAQMAAGLGVKTAVDLPGASDNPAHWMARCKIFALSSRYEGFPNVLLEAMACGAAPVAFDCRSGPRDIIRDCENGLLVPAEDVDAMGAALARLANDRNLLNRIASAATDVRQTFAPDRVLNEWVSVLTAATMPITHR